jgi:hypothetical protein
MVLVAVCGFVGFSGIARLDAWQTPQVRRVAATSASAPAPRASLPKGIGLEPRVPVDGKLEPLVQAGLSDDAETSAKAIAQLRKLGRPALEYVIGRTTSERFERWRHLADSVAQQRDSQFSRLFWYSDLNEAKAVAAQEKKPILSLRLLGKLTDELSCANSRYFRTVLYPNESVRRVLAEKYVLHWESVRAVPIITIDFGDGRSIKRTITGNSLHLVLDTRGRTVDVVPGLYGPGMFVRVLGQSEELAKRAAEFSDAEFKSAVARLHHDQLKEQQTRWDADWAKLGQESSPSLDQDLNDAEWNKLIPQYSAEIALDQAAATAIAAKAPAEVAARVAMTKMVAEAPGMRMVRNLRPVLGLDSLQNEYKLHRRIHQWLADERQVLDQALTSRVYRDLFLSPLEDPWLGLSQPDVFSAVENDGRHYAVTATQNAGH